MEDLNLKEGFLGGPQWNMTSILAIRGNKGMDTHSGKTRCIQTERMNIYKPRSEASGKTYPAET
jgi:hypothetical protein